MTMKRTKGKDILKSILDISGFTHLVENPELILSLIIEESVLSTRATWGAFLSYDANFTLDSFQLTLLLNDKEKKNMRSLLDEKARAIVGTGGKDCLDESFWRSKELRTSFKKSLEIKEKDILLCPVKRKDSFLALAVVAGKKGKGIFSKADADNLGIICQEAAIVIENIRLFKNKIRNERMAAVGQAITGISHYVKNILQGISLGSSLLDAGIRDKDFSVAKEAWNVVNKNTERISGLVLDMLYYSKESKAAKKMADPKALMEDVLELLEPKAKEKGIRIEKVFKDIPDRMAINDNGIHRSILNLVGNAADACDKPNSIIKFEAWTDKPKGLLNIRISDNGKGMNKEDTEKIFQPFFTKNKGKGTGLGLAITRKIIEEHDGSISVESEPGKGASFLISIPVRKETA